MGGWLIELLMIGGEGGYIGGNGDYDPRVERRVVHPAISEAGELHGVCQELYEYWSIEVEKLHALEVALHGLRVHYTTSHEMIVSLQYEILKVERIIAQIEANFEKELSRLTQIIKEREQTN